MFRAAGFLNQVVLPGRTHSLEGTLQEEVRLPASAGSMVEAPTAGLVLWRGASIDTYDGRGMSWTRYEDCARQFAQRHADEDQRPAASTGPRCQPAASWPCLPTSERKRSSSTRTFSYVV